MWIFTREWPPETCPALRPLRTVVLTVGGYNTMYCDREIPGSNSKTCRMIGAHEREKAANQSSEARKEYSRIYNKLKARKQRGTISTDQWNPTNRRRPATEGRLCRRQD